MDVMLYHPILKTKWEDCLLRSQSASRLARGGGTEESFEECGFFDDSDDDDKDFTACS